jgi:polysaccharide export outer membrane protein
MSVVSSVRFAGLVSIIITLLVWAQTVTADEDYLLGGGDTVTISVYDQPDLSTEARISQDNGTITFPLLGEVAIAGLSPAQAGKKIAGLLERGKFLKNAQVALTVKDFRSQKIPVMGQVNKPGEYSLMGESKVVDLISQAGGLKDDAADVITVVKKDGDKSVKHEIDLLRFYAGDMSQNITVSRGDFILVPKMDTFYIHGEVKRPGQYRLERGMTVMQALSVGGGLSERGSLSGMKVTRGKGDGTTKKVDVDLTDKLQPNDVLYERPDKPMTSNELNIEKIFQILRTRIQLVIGVFLGCVLVAAIITFQLPKMYQATATLNFDFSSSNPIDSRGRSVLSEESYLTTQVGILQSLNVAQQVVSGLSDYQRDRVIAAL